VPGVRSRVTEPTIRSIGLFGWNQGPFELMTLNFRLLLVLREGGEDGGEAGVERAVQL
jgi:hypothetical protein